MKNRKRDFTIGVVIICLIFVFAPMARSMDQTVGDTVIFSGSITGVKPNVLILFDTSGSMKMEPKVVDQTDYDPSVDYKATQSPSSPYSRYKVYYYDSGSSGWGGTAAGWYEFTSSTSNLGCAAAKSALDSIGYWQGDIGTTSPFNCGGTTSRQLRTGNYLTYDSLSASNTDWKINVARKVIEDLMNSMAIGTAAGKNIDPVNWGLMTFNDNECGGKLVVGCGTSSTDIINNYLEYPPLSSNRFYNPSGGTPLAESLVEAGLYFAGKRSWTFSTTYTSPILYRCQPNYVIVVTDGNSTWDTGKKSAHNDTNSCAQWDNLFTNTYPFDKAISDYDHDGCDPDVETSPCPVAKRASISDYGTHYLDDVAAFLYNEDLRNTTDLDNGGLGVSFNASDFPKQTITTHYIAFGEDTSALPLLRSAAANGGGTLQLSTSSAELRDALMSIMDNVFTDSRTFISPVVPVSKLNKTYSGTSIYLGQFKPLKGGIWRGNLKKYGFNSAGELLTKNGTSATVTGIFTDDAISCWSSTTDGKDVDKGGAGENLMNQTTRYFLTYNPTRAVANLGNAYNAFSSSNADITTTILSGSGGTLTAVNRTDLFNFMRAEGDYLPGTTNDKSLPWVMGDILHSRPAVMYDGSNKTVLFVGSNDGYMHCFVDNDQGDNNPTDGSDPNWANDTISEAWCFVPWDLLGELREMHPTLKQDKVHNYYVDGIPTLFTTGSNKYLTFGLRRGGSRYYTLDVGNVNTSTGELSAGTYTYDNISYVWQMNDTVLGTGDETLGESWCKPFFCKLKTASGQTTYQDTLLFTGGYDNANEDLDSPSTTGDTKGRALFAVNPADGSVRNQFKFSRTGGCTQLTHSIIDLTAFDYNNQGRVDTIYAGDLGGNLHAFNDRDGNAGWSDNGSPLHLFRASNTSLTETKYIKFFYAPDVVLESFGDYVYIGSGDREHPNETATVNRFYAIKNTWATSGMPLTESSTGYLDVSHYTSIDVYPYSASYMYGDSCKGWYIKMPHTAEKVVSSPLVYNGIVYFTTFVPEVGSTTTDKCATSGLGNGYIWAIDYKTGEAIKELNFNETNDTTDAQGNKVIKLDETDRYKSVGEGMPTQPSLVVTSEGAKIVVGTDKGVVTIDDPTKRSATRYFWRQN